MFLYVINMRASGILLHISSLPSPYGIGTLGKEAYEFVDMLKKMGQRYWQVLPIGPTSYGDSPYQTFSAFAGNPYFIDLDQLVLDGLLNKEDLKNLKVKDPKKVDYEWLYRTRFIILKKAYNNYMSLDSNEDLTNFIEENSFWLEDYALFMAIKYDQVEGNWHGWNKKYHLRHSYETIEFSQKHQKDISFWMFVQYLFFKQWHALKDYANENGIELIGDMPIYVAYDSSDVWANPEYWQLDEDLVPTVVAGVPPDYFAKTGQLWGNPIYNYELMKKKGYSWWVKRIEESFKIFDVLRIDHFRGFEAYYAIPSTDKTAEFGHWVKGPGVELSQKVKEKLGDLKIIAEDLGFLTPEVKELLKACGYPGMKILQFGMNPNEDSDYLPHNYPTNSICYTGTHDNMTLKEWLTTINKNEKAFCYDYAGITKDEDAINRLICMVLGSVSERAIIPLRDYLELGKEGRFNIPSTLGGNWTWRLAKGELTEEIKKRILYNTKLYKR